jgi:hypothetical protein
MRTLFLPLVVVSLLALVGPSSAEFDSAGIAPAKAKVTQSTRATFENGIAASRPAQTGALIVDGVTFVRLAGGAGLRCVALMIRLDGPQPTINNPSNIPRPKR